MSSWNGQGASSTSDTSAARGGYPAEVTDSQTDDIDLERHDGRALDELRPCVFVRDFTEFAAGSVLAVYGRTKVLCTASVDEDVPRWMRGTGRGWVTAEYSLLPGSSPEIQRLIGRALRSIIDLEALGERQILIDCDVLQADGGTRTASISGAYVALHDACTRLCLSGVLKDHPVREACGAVSVGIVEAVCMLDLDYVEDSAAEVDLNVVMTSSGRFVEVQGTAEGPPFARSELDEMLNLAELGIGQILQIQNEVLASPPPDRNRAAAI